MGHKHRYARVGNTIVRFSTQPARDAWVKAGKKAGEDRVAIASADVPSRVKVGRLDLDGGWTLVDALEGE